MTTSIIKGLCMECNIIQTLHKSPLSQSFMTDKYDNQANMYLCMYLYIHIYMCVHVE